nr:phosphoribosylanthranilate isomerase [uncultured Blautia sp.]
MPKVKICGLRTLEDIQAVNDCKPDFAGFIVEYPKSRRSITSDELKKLTGQLDQGICAVGVFVNAQIKLVADLLNQGVIQIAQLHRQEEEAYIRQLQADTGRKVIKAFSIKTEEDIAKAEVSSADYVLLDQGSGGTGKTFDWLLAKKISRPYFLAGGLGVDNLESAVKSLNPWAVDLSSSVETDGKKDPEKIRQAVELVRKL